MRGKEKKLALLALLLSALLLGGVYAATRMGSSSPVATSSTDSNTPTGVFTAPPVVTGSTNTTPDGSVGNQTTTVGSIGAFIPGGISDLQSASSGSSDYVSYKRGPVSVNVTSQPLVTGDDVASVSQLYGNSRTAKKFPVADGVGYLFEHASGGDVVFNAVTIQKKNVVILTTTAPIHQEARARAELMHAAAKLKIFKTS
jgi:hypothetical protein